MTVESWQLPVELAVAKLVEVFQWFAKMHLHLMSTEDPKALLHKLNNQLGVILAHAELLETKAQDTAQKARASQVVNAALQAMAVSRELRGYIDQLLAHGLLQQSGEEYPVLQISAEGHALLKDAGAMPDLSLARQKRPDRTRLPKRSRVETEGWDGVDRELFEELRVLRLEIARRRRVPPYVIFHDTTLREIARSKPKTKTDLRQVYGVGDRKAEDLGDLILEVVRRS